MSMAARELQPGDKAFTDYNGHCEKLEVVIKARREQRRSQSGIQFQVSPTMRNGHAASWYDADWFQPAERPKTQK